MPPSRFPRANSSNRREKLLLAYSRNANDASESTFRQRLRTVNRDYNSVRDSGLDEHMMTALDPVQSKAKSVQRPNSLPAGDSRVGGH